MRIITWNSDVVQHLLDKYIYLKDVVELEFSNKKFDQQKVELIPKRDKSTGCIQIGTANVTTPSIKLRYDGGFQGFAPRDYSPTLNITD